MISKFNFIKMLKKIKISSNIINKVKIKKNKYLSLLKYDEFKKIKNSGIFNIYIFMNLISLNKYLYYSIIMKSKKFIDFTIILLRSIFLYFKFKSY